MRIQDRFNAIKSCESMAYAPRTAVDHYGSLLESQKRLIPANAGFNINDLRNCGNDLENTYLIRAFVEFETTLRNFWEIGMGRSRRTSPKISTLIDRIASRRHILTDDMENAHAVREYRNSLIHGGDAPSVTLAEARRYLCAFLRHLPIQWG